MQLFTDFSEEGEGSGLGWIRARTERFFFVDRERPLKIPHVGWNTVRTSRTSALWEGIEAEDFFYLFIPIMSSAISRRMRWGLRNTALNFIRRSIGKTFMAFNFTPKKALSRAGEC